jgi:hypothetical protein
VNLTFEKEGTVKQAKAPVESHSSSESTPKKPIHKVKLSEQASTSADTLEEQVRARAYQLYEERGRHEGHSDEDWQQAEAEVLSRNSQVSAA